MGVDRSEIVAHAQHELDFLRTDFGFRLEVEDGAAQTVMAYVGDRYTLELELDWRERAAFLLVARTENGQRPPGYYVHAGRRVRTHLTAVLDGGDAEDRLLADVLRAAVKDSGQAAMERQIGRYAAALADVLRRNRAGTWSCIDF